MPTLTAEVPVKFRPAGCTDLEVAYPTIEIEFDYTPGRRAFTPRGEYAPIDPPEPPEVSLRAARLINGDGLEPRDDKMVQDWAADYLDSDEGFEVACEAGEEARLPDPDYERERRRDEREDWPCR